MAKQYRIIKVGEYYIPQVKRLFGWKGLSCNTVGREYSDRSEQLDKCSLKNKANAQKVIMVDEYEKANQRGGDAS